MAQPGRPITAPCGTASAYRRHLRYKEEPCDACRAAGRAYDQARLSRKEKPPPPPPPPCGTTARWSRGCRCSECGLANRLSKYHMSSADYNAILASQNG